MSSVVDERGSRGDGPERTGAAVAGPDGSAARRTGAEGADPRLGAPPTAVTGRYLPALDGLRGVAIIAVFAYHLGLGRGTYLGVDLFFVLSGFLITSLLLEERVLTGAIKLAQFWARRARRLLPALFVVLAAIGLFVILYGRFGGPGAAAQIDLPGLRGDALAALFYVANWHFIWAHQSYFAQFQSVSPLLHTWSLSIEEQFYLVWPLVLVVTLRRLGTRWRHRVLAITVVGAVVSAALMAALFAAGASASFLYYGTETRACDILAGATVAALVAARPQLSAAGRRRLHWLGLLAAVGVVGFLVVAGTGSGATGGNGVPSAWMFQGGFLAFGVLAAVVIADVRQLQPGPLGAALSIRPLRWVGMISYGLYLWHWPVIVYLTPARTGLSGAALDVVRVAVAVGAATASFYLIERPIRHHRFKGTLRFGIAPLAAALTAVVVVVATIPSVVVPTEAAPAARSIAPAQGRVVAGSGGFGNEARITLPPGRVVTPQDPLRVVMIGDSVMQTAEPPIARALEATGEAVVFRNAFPGWGLSTDPGWPAHLRSLVAQERPDLVLGMWSWDDAWAQRRPRQYEATFVRALHELTTPTGTAAGLIMIQEPVPGVGKISHPSGAKSVALVRNLAGRDAFERVVQQLVRRHPGKLMYLPMSSAVELDGHFSPWLPPPTAPHAPKSQWVRVRMVDGAHLCPAGADRYAAAVLTDVRAMYHLPAAKGSWWSGSWTNDARYSTPAGSCPDDHPPS